MRVDMTQSCRIKNKALQQFLIDRGYRRLVAAIVKQMVRDYAKGEISVEDMVVVFRGIDIHTMPKVNRSPKKHFIVDEIEEKQESENRIAQFV
jgi:hypothetical protein